MPSFFRAVTKQVDILWKQCQDILSDNLSRSAYQTWFAPIVPLQYENDVLILQVKSQFIASYIEENYIDLLSKVLFRVFGPQTRLQYRALIDAESGAGSTIPSNNNARTRTESDLDSQLNESYTFASFIAGEPNKLARTAGVTVAKQPGYTAFNPLFIYGGSKIL